MYRISEIHMIAFNVLGYLQILELNIPLFHSCSILFLVTFSSNLTDFPWN